jgi:hypothetical protein
MKILKTAWATLAVLTLTVPAFAGHHGKKMDVVDTAAAPLSLLRRRPVSSMH